MKEKKNPSWHCKLLFSRLLFHLLFFPPGNVYLGLYLLFNKSALQFLSFFCSNTIIWKMMNYWEFFQSRVGQKWFLVGELIKIFTFARRPRCSRCICCAINRILAFLRAVKETRARPCASLACKYDNGHKNLYWVKERPFHRLTFWLCGLYKSKWQCLKNIKVPFLFFPFAGVICEGLLLLLL